MSMSNNPHSYEDVRAAFDRALSSEKGIKVDASQPTDDRAKKYQRSVSLRQRMYRFRKLDRAQAERAFEPGDERWGRTVYDSLILDIAKPDSPEVGIVYVRKGVAFRIEEL